MQNIQERFTGLWPVTGASSRRTARFAVSISASLTAGLTTSVDIGKAKSIENGFLKKITDFPRVVPHFFFRNLTCLYTIKSEWSIVYIEGSQFIIS